MSNKTLILEEQSLFFNEDSLNEGLAFSDKDVIRNYNATAKAYNKIFNSCKDKNNIKRLKRFYRRLNEIEEITKRRYKDGNYAGVIRYMRNSAVATMKLLGFSAAIIASLGFIVNGASMVGGGALINSVGGALGIGHYGTGAIVAGGIEMAAGAGGAAYSTYRIAQAGSNKVYEKTTKEYSEKFLRLLDEYKRKCESILKKY